MRGVPVVGRASAARCRVPGGPLACDPASSGVIRLGALARLTWWPLSLRSAHRRSALGVVGPVIAAPLPPTGRLPAGNAWSVRILARAGLSVGDPIT